MTEHNSISSDDWKRALKVSRFREMVSSEARKAASLAAEALPRVSELQAAREKLTASQKQVEECDFVTKGDKLVLTWRIMRAGLAIKTALERAGRL